MSGTIGGLLASLVRLASSSVSFLWSKQTLPAAAQYLDAKYSPFLGVYFAIGSGANSQNYIYSTNGTSWSTGTLPVSAVWTAIASDNTSRLVAIRASNTGANAAYSSDGISWTSVQVSASRSLTSGQVIWDGTRFITTNTNSNATVIFYSTNGSSWLTNNTIGSPTRHIGVDGLGGYLMTLAGVTDRNRYTNGSPTSSWTTGIFPSSGIWLSPVYGNNIWVVFKAGSNEYITSSDKIVWTSRTLPTNFSETTAEVHAKAFFVEGKFYYYYTDTLRSSSDGINWEVEDTFASSTLDQINGWAYSGSKLVGVGYNSATSGDSTDSFILGELP